MQHTPAPSGQPDPTPQPLVPDPGALVPADLSSPADPVEAALTVVALTVESYQRITVANVRPSPTGLVLVRGENANGKSSLIGAMMDALGAERGKLPITEGSHKSDVTVDLGSIVVRKRYTKDGAGKAKPKIMIETADGSKVKGTPAAILKELRGFFADPVAFLELPALEQVKVVLGVLGLAEKLDDLEAQHDGSYDRRRDLGRDADQAKKAVAELQVEVDELPVPPPADGIDKLTTDLQTANQHNAQIDGVTGQRTAAESRGKELAVRIPQIEASIAELQRQLDQAASQLQEAKAQKDAAESEWQTANNALKLTRRVDTAQIAEELRQQQRAIEDAAAYAGKRELLAHTIGLAEKAAVAHEAEKEKLEGIRGQIAKLLSETDFPIEGMTFDPATKLLMIGAIPFESASQAERIKAAAAIAMAGNPRLKVIFAREGSLLDHASQMQLAQIAEAHGFQLWLEVVDSNPEGAGLWIQDGEVFQNGVLTALPSVANSAAPPVTQEACPHELPPATPFGSQPPPVAPPAPGGPLA